MKAWQIAAITIILWGMALSCRNDTPPGNPKIEKITFEESFRNIYVGDTVKININAEPNEAKKYDKIEYRTSENGIIEIKEDSGNDGVVFMGLKRGSTIITAAVNGIVDYCNVNVLGADESVIPHIIVRDYVIECRENERRGINASLAGGTPLDDGGFIWSYTNQKVINLVPTGNIGVFETIGIGSSVVTISHPKAQFSVDVLIYVLGSDEIPVYITTDNNVVKIKTTDSNYQYAVELRGGDSDDYNYFRHELTEGEDVIDLQINNNIGTINPKKKGLARIGISHTKAAYSLDIVVIVREEAEYRYIDIDKTLIIMEEGQTELIKMELIGDAPPNHIDKYTIENENDDVITVRKFGNQAGVTGIKRGKSVIKIKNLYADFDREVLVIVNGITSFQDTEVYITTNQNVITTEVGGDDVILTMTLVGGNEADRNNFVWTVDDGSIISVQSAEGTVNYRNRAAVSNSGEKFEAQAVISAKKVGTAKIILENPKAKNTFSVLVKVYKKGIFGIVPIVIDGPSIYKVKIGEQLPAYLGIVTGNDKYLTNVTWASNNENILTVSGAGLTGILDGKENGVTSITVSADNIKHNYTATVIVGDDEYIQTMSYMYVLNPFMSVVNGESVSFRIMCVNMSSEDIANISVVNNNGELMEVMTYKNNVTVTGIAPGEGEIIISKNGINTLRVIVMVEDYDINPDMPYYLRTNKIIYGLIRGQNLEIGVDLIGGNEVNERGIIWKIEDSDIAMINGNGKRCVITGRNSGQTLITANHPKSQNALEIVIYTAENESELHSTVIMYVKEKNMLLNVGETRYISIITNANDAQKNSFSWDISNTNVIGVRVSGDRIKAYIEANNLGNAAITVRSGNLKLPLVIHVSVINGVYGGTYINVPSIVEMIAGDTIFVNAITDNIYDLLSIKWNCKNNDIAAVYGNGETCMVNALKGGNTVITAEYAPTGFVKDIILYVYNSAEEMASRYIIAGEQSRYVINKGDILNVNVVFGMKGYPEYELHNIGWSTADSTIIEVTGNGKSASIKGINSGIGIVHISDRYENDIQMEIEVRDIGKAGQYWFSIRPEDRIKGLLAGSYADIEVKVYNGSNEVFNISGIEYIVGNTDIISIDGINANNIRVFAAAEKEGSSYITIRHDLMEETKILIYTALNEYGLDNAYPILVEKTNYLVKKGENVTITVQTKDNDPSKLRNISYETERNNGVIGVSEKNRREILVSANNTGSDIIVIRYNAEPVQRIYVSVTEGNYPASAGYMATENIIGLLMGKEYETRVQTDAQAIIWTKKDDYVFDIVSTSGKSAVIKGHIPGKSLLTVSGGNIERTIAVFVCETTEELLSFQAINIEQRNYFIRKNDSVTINIYSYQGKVNGHTLLDDYYSYEIPYGNVVEVNAVDNNKFSVKGLNEGTAVIRVSNEYYRTEMTVYIEVMPAGEGITGFIDNKNYITAAKTLYVIDRNEQNVMISVGVVGDNFWGDSYWEWKDYDSSIINVSATGRNAFVSPKEEGKTIIKVSNRDCANYLEITVIVGDRFIVDGGLLPYIYVEKNVYEVTKDAGVINIPYSIVNVSDFNAANVRWELFGNTIGLSHDAGRSVFTVTVHDTGIARFDIAYGNLRREVFVLVKEDMNFGNVYLTTSENYVVASVGELRTVHIQLAGYSEINNNSFTWSVEPGNGVVQVSGNGAVCQIFGISAGDAVITVRHPKSQFPLHINVKIVKDKVKESVIYLTTQRNVIETVAGTAGEQIYVQKIGGDIIKDRTTWTVSDSSIVGISSQGYTAQISAKKEGIARIRVQNIESDYKLEIIIIVNKPLNNNIYINSASTLLMLNPGEVQRRISVSLVNGEEKDNNKFIWSIDHQQPSTIKAGVPPNSKVINIIGSNEECFINAINEGTARIRVHNEKAERDLIITVYVTSYKEIKFSVRKKEIVIGENEFVGINLPTYEYFGNKVKVWVEKPDGSLGSGICDVFYTNELVLLSGKITGSVIVKAEIEGKEGQAQLYVNVVENNDPNVNRIVAGKTLHVINMRSQPLTLNALVSGPSVFDIDNDNIEWHLGNTGIIDIMPKNEPFSSAKGRQVQITVKGLGTATLLVKHDYVDEAYWKEISVIVADTNNIFSVSRTDITVNSSRPETVAAEIVGGTTRDYAEVKWIAKMQQKWDGTMLEIVRIFGSGREVTLYPMNDGETEVLVMYGKEVAVIKVEVVSDYYFSFRNGNEFMYPGEIRELPFDVKPANSTVSWIDMSMPGDTEGPVIIFGEVLGSKPNGNGSAERNIRVEALREGTMSITGVSNGRVARANINVQYNYSFNTTVNYVHGHPKYYGRVNDKIINEDGKCEVKYTVYPPDTYILPVEGVAEGLTVEIESPVVQKTEDGGISGGPGIGKIIFTGNKELIANVKFKQFKKRKNNNDPLVETGVEKTITAVYMFGFSGPISIVPYFVRGDGVYSNTGQTQYTLMNGNTPLNVEKINKIAGFADRYGFTLGDGEQHYILFDSPYDTAMLDILSVTPGSHFLEDNLYNFDFVNISSNGITRKALRLSGGSDYIEYNRVAFDKKLYMYVESDSMEGGNYNVITKLRPIYDSCDYISDLIKTRDITGPWESYFKDTSGQITTFYLLKNDSLMGMDLYERNLAMNTYNPARISEDPLLIEKALDIKYTYYYRSNSGITAEYRAFMNKYCDSYDAYPILYTYDWKYYRDNQEDFDDSQYEIDKSALVYANDEETGELTDQIIGGSITTLLQLNGKYIELEIPANITIYGYDRQNLLDYINMGKLSENLLSPWNPGGFIHGYIPFLHDYQDTYMYSTVQHQINVVEVIPGGNRTVTSIYDVFASNFVDDNKAPVSKGYNVYIPVPPSASTSYQSGAKSKGTENDTEYLAYTNIRNGYLLNMGGVNVGTSKLMPITGDIKSRSRYVEKEEATYLFYPHMTVSPGAPSNYNPPSPPPRTITYNKREIYYTYPVKEKLFEYEGIPQTNGEIRRYYRSVANNFTYAEETLGWYDYPISNRNGRNIFGGEKDTISYGNWSSYYYTGAYKYDSFLGRGDFQIYGESRARQKLQWENTGKVIAPYYVFNRFPFRYEPANSAIGQKYPAKQIVSLKQEGAKPMPSIDTSPGKSKEVSIDVKYTVFDPGQDSGKIEKHITFIITLQQRKCHMMYTNPGNKNDSSINFVNTNDGWLEYEGEINKFDNMGNNSNYAKYY